MNSSDILTLQGSDALVVVDIQYDFIPGGTLSVTGGDLVIEPLNHAITVFHDRNLPIFFTRDWHPSHHCSFEENNGSWPPHCVQGTKGAEFVSTLFMPDDAVIISKGAHLEYDQYSTAFGVDDQGRTLESILHGLDVKRVFIGGLATDYCVLNSVTDLKKEGFDVFVLRDGSAAVNVHPGDEQRALETMKELGASLITTKMIG